MNEEQRIECACGCGVLIVERMYGNDYFVSIKLNKLPFIRRVWNAFRYVFDLGSYIDEHQDIILKSEDVSRFVRFFTHAEIRQYPKMSSGNRDGFGNITITEG